MRINPLILNKKSSVSILATLISKYPTSTYGVESPIKDFAYSAFPVIVRVLSGFTAMGSPDSLRTNT